MKNKIISFLIFILLGSSVSFAQQIPMFNSYVLNRYLVNPSYAGLGGKTSFYGLNRIQFAGFEGAPVTYMVAGDAGFKNKKFGIGGVGFSDRNNLIAQNGFQLSYSYNLKLNEQYSLGMGLSAGMVQWSLNFDQLRVEDPSEAVITNARSNATTFRSDIGFRVTSDKLDFGIALPQIVSSKLKYSDYVKNSNGKYTSIPHYIVNLGYWLNIKENIRLKPMVLVRGASGISPQIDAIGLLDYANKAYLTVGYRTNFAATIGGGVKLPSGITIGYTFDRPLNDISTFSKGSHEFVLGITLGGAKGGKSEEADALSKEAEAKLKADMEKSIREKLSQEFDSKLNMEIDSKINNAVSEKVAKAMEGMKTTTSPSTGDTKTTPGSTATLSAAEIEKMKKDIQDQVKKQMEESLNKTVDDKVKKAMEGVKTTPDKPTTAQVSKEDLDKIQKENEEKIRKQVEEKVNKELADKVSKAVAEKLAAEMQRQKDEAAKDPNAYKMTMKDKVMMDSLKMKNSDYEKRIAELEKQLKMFPEKERMENKDMNNIRRIVHQNDIDLKNYKIENQAAFEKATDGKKAKEATDEPGKFIVVLAAFRNMKDVQDYQKLGAQTFEFSDLKIFRPDDLEGWFFVYQKSFDKKKEAIMAYQKVFESETNTPKYPFIYVMKTP